MPRCWWVDRAFCERALGGSGDRAGTVLVLELVGGYKGVPQAALIKLNKNVLFHSKKGKYMGFIRKAAVVPASHRPYITGSQGVSNLGSARPRSVSAHPTSAPAHFTHQTTEAQRGQATRPPPHSGSSAAVCLQHGEPAATPPARLSL